MRAEQSSAASLRVESSFPKNLNQEMRWVPKIADAAQTEVLAAALLSNASLSLKDPTARLDSRSSCSSCAESTTPKLQNVFSLRPSAICIRLI